MPIISVITSEHDQMIDITERVNKIVPAGFSGVCVLFSKHTTAALTINENADPDVCSDMICFLDQQVPWKSSLFRHFEGNSAAHIKASFFGFSQTVPVVNGKLSLGTWQGIYFCEFDGGRSREVEVTFIPGM